jgi:parallel beta-helix repeat protein
MKKRGGNFLVFALAVFLFFIVLFPLVTSSTPGDIASCQTLDTSGVYTLTADLNGSDVPEEGCFNITNMDVELNCQGHYIGNETSTGYAILSDEVTNTTVKNCRVSFPAGYGAYFNISNGGRIINSSFNFSIYGIYLFQSTNNITNVTLYGNTYGIYLNDTDLSRVNDSMIESNSYGIYLSNSDSNIISNINGSANTRGAYLNASSSNNLSNSSFYSGGAPGITVHFGTGNQIVNCTAKDYEGILLDSDTSTIISNSTVFNNVGGYGLRLISSSNAYIINLNSTSNIYGISLESSSNNRIIDSTSHNNSLYLGTGGYGLWITGGSNNTISGNNISSNSAEGVLLSHTTNNSLLNNNISGGKDFGFDLEGNTSSDFNNTISADNLIDGKVLYYNFSISNYNYNETTALNARSIYCAFCNNVAVKNLNITNSYGGVSGNSYVYNGIIFYNTSNSSIQNITSAFNLYGIRLSYSNDTNITNVSLSMSYSGVYMENGSNIRMINVTSFNNSRGIYESEGNQISITNSSAYSNTYGIWLDRSNNTNVSGANLTTNSQFGFYIWYVLNLTLSNNIMNQSDQDFFLYGSSTAEYNHTILTDNFLEGKTLYYNVSLSDYTYNETTVPNAGAVYCINCSNSTFTGLNLTATNISYGIYLWYPRNTTIQNVSVSGKKGTGVYIYYGSGDQIVNSTFNNNSGAGINLASSNYSNLTNVTANYNGQGIVFGGINATLNNCIANNNYYGFYISSAINASLINCTANNNINTSSSNGVGFYVYQSSKSYIINCTANSNKRGISFEQTAVNDSVLGVTASSNSESGVYIATSSKNISISNTTLNSNVYGLYLLYVSDNNITNSTLNSNSLYGVYLSSSDNNTARFNNVTSNVYGFYLASSDNNNITSNTILSSTTNATYVDGSSTGNNISGNTLPAAAEDDDTVDLGGGGGGGGGGGSDWTVTYTTLTDSQFSLGYTKELAIKSRIGFKIGNETHYVGVINVTSTAVTVNVSSTPQQKIMKIGEEWKVDVNGDGSSDVLVKLAGINNSRATVDIQKAEEVASTVGDSDSNESSSDSSNEAETSGGELGSFEEGMSWIESLNKKVIGAVAAGILILIVIVFFLVRKKK